MSRNLAFAAVIGFALATGACAQFETSHESLTPSAPSPIPNGSSEGPLVGTWQPPQGVAAPDPSTCGNFQWVITSQSDVAVQGSFSAECGGGVSIAATVQGTLNNPTTVTVAIQGTGIINGLGCPFTLNGVGTIFDNNNAIINNETFHKYLTAGVDVEERTADGICGQKVYMVYFSKPENN